MDMSINWWTHDVKSTARKIIIHERRIVVKSVVGHRVLENVSDESGGESLSFVAPLLVALLVITSVALYNFCASTIQENEIRGKEEILAEGEIRTEILQRMFWSDFFERARLGFRQSAMVREEESLSREVSDLESQISSVSEEISGLKIQLAGGR